MLVQMIVLSVKKANSVSHKLPCAHFVKPVLFRTRTGQVALFAELVTSHLKEIRLARSVMPRKDSMLPTRACRRALTAVWVTESATIVVFPVKKTHILRVVLNLARHARTTRTAQVVLLTATSAAVGRDMTEAVLLWQTSV